MLTTCLILLLPIGRYVDDWLRGPDFCGNELDLIFSRDTRRFLKVFYADEGLSTLDSNKVLQLQPFTEMGAPMEIVKNAFGSKSAYDQAIQNLEQELFKQDESA